MNIKSCAISWSYSICSFIIGLIFIIIGISLINDSYSYEIIYGMITKVCRDTAERGFGYIFLIPGIILELFSIYWGIKSCFHFLEHIDRLQTIQYKITSIDSTLERIDKHICEGFNWLSDTITKE